ncbi:MAG TPA: glycosyltransferase [Azospirillaceae bacterium]|nr:glycosyltransferase [Azospirillaceae bacterium]
MAASEGRFPFVSVVVPHLNQPAFLARCLRSLEAQDYPRDRFEIIVADNGSVEVTARSLRRLTGIRIVTEPKPGPGCARNAGVAVAAGTVLAFVDADCTAHPRWLSAAVERLRRGDCDVVGGDVRIAVGDPERLTDLEAYESVFAYRQQEYIEKQGFSGTGNLAMGRETFDRVGPFGGIEVAEDRDWGQRAAALGLRTAYCPDMVVYHPARRSYAEIFAKWRRHTVHDFNRHREAGRSRLTWLARALAVLASPPAHAVRIVRSDRLDGAGARLRAAKALLTIRVYRAWYMARVAFAADGEGRPLWNRAEPGTPVPSR